MKVNCLSCGHRVDVDDAYSDYEGQLKCMVCGAMLEVRIEEGSIRWVKLARVLVATATRKDALVSAS